MQYHPTGLLALKIQEYTGDGLHKLWSDGKRQKIEDLLNSFIAGLIHVGEWKKAQRLKRKREHQKWLEAEQHRQKLEQRRLEEEAKIRQFEQEVSNWHKAQKIRSYLAAIRETMSQKRAAGEESNQKVEEWFVWANRYADDLDPLKQS